MRQIAIALTLTACSIGMKPVPPGWDGSYEPECTDDQSTVYLDAIGSGLLLGFGAGAADKSAESENEVVAGLAVVGIVGGLVLGISALIGNGKYTACHEALAEWRIGGAIGRASVANRTGLTADEEQKRQDLEQRLSTSEWCVGDTCFAERAACARRAGLTGASEGCKERKTPPIRPSVVPAQPPAVQPAVQPPAVQPRGFYCSISPTAGFCVREKAECVRTRDISLAALPDLAECALTEKAWCTGDLCFPVQEQCEARATKGGGACVESE